MLIKQFLAARRASTPIVAITSHDPSATIESIKTALSDTKNQKDAPIVQWDLIRGFSALNDSGAQAIQSMGVSPDAQVTAPDVALTFVTKMPRLSITFVHNFHLIAAQEPVRQAVWNIRDIYKENKRTLVLLCPEITLTSELQQDVLVLHEALPTVEELGTIVTKLYSEAKAVHTVLPELKPETINHATDALCGLAAFPAEQSTAMSITESGIDLSGLWERKREMIEQTPGLSVWRGGETFADVEGYQNAKDYISQLLAGNEAPRAIVFVDEIEKAMAGASGDTSGVSQNMHGALLTWMQDKKASGNIFIGPPGTGKSAIAKAAGASAGIPTIALDLSAMKGSLVGESESNLRRALQVIEAVSQGRSHWIATCNSIGILSPELRRRFTFGTFFFDLPTEKERKRIWQLYISKYDIISCDFPSDDGWTGAEISQCCLLSYRLKCSLKDAAKFIVPVSVSAADSIKRLQEQANGKFISASYSGIYLTDRPIAAKGRNLELEN